MSPMRSTAGAALLFGAMMGLAMVAVMIATVPAERAEPPAPVTLIGPGEPVFALRAPADRGEPSVAPAIDRDDEPDFGPAHAVAVEYGLWLDPGRLDRLAPELQRLPAGHDHLRPQMPRPAVSKAARERPRPRRPPARVERRADRPGADPGPAASGPRWPTYLVRVRGEQPVDWRDGIFRGGQ